MDESHVGDEEFKKIIVAFLFEIGQAQERVERKLSTAVTTLKRIDRRFMKKRARARGE